MAVEIERDVVENYQALRVERGLSWEQLAAQVHALDPNLAAWFRSQSAAEDKKPQSKKPVGRTAAPKSEA